MDGGGTTMYDCLRGNCGVLVSSFVVGANNCNAGAASSVGGAAAAGRFVRRGLRGGGMGIGGFAWTVCS